MAIPKLTFDVLGRSTPVWLFAPDADYEVDGVTLQEIEVLMRRLFTEQRMGADEMRDWANLLRLRLERATGI